MRTISGFGQFSRKPNPALSPESISLAFSPNHFYSYPSLKFLGSVPDLKSSLGQNLRCPQFSQRPIIPPQRAVAGFPKS
jgi:hypothetical protein